MLILDIGQIPMDLYFVTTRSPLEVRLELRLRESIPVSDTGSRLQMIDQNWFIFFLSMKQTNMCQLTVVPLWPAIKLQQSADPHWFTPCLVKS